jgi:hypothetical protein
VRRILKHVCRCAVVTGISIRHTVWGNQLINTIDWLQKLMKTETETFHRKTKLSHALSVTLQARCLQHDWHFQGPVIAKHLSMSVHAALSNAPWTGPTHTNIIKINNFPESVPMVRPLFTHLSPRRPGFDPPAIRTNRHYIRFIHREFRFVPRQSASQPVSIPPNSNNHISLPTGTVGQAHSNRSAKTLGPIPMPRLQEDTYSHCQQVF